MRQDDPQRWEDIEVPNVEEGGAPLAFPAGMLQGRGRRSAVKMDLEQPRSHAAVKRPIGGEGSPGSISLDFWEAAKHRQDDLTYPTDGTVSGPGHLLPWVASGRNRQEHMVLQAIVLELPNGEGFRVWTRSKRHVNTLAFWSLPWIKGAEHGSPLEFLVRHLGEDGAAVWLASPHVKTKAGGVKIKPPYRVSLDHPTVKRWHDLKRAADPIPANMTAGSPLALY